MSTRYEVWRYSESWRTWVRDIYRDADQAQRRYEFLQRRGKRVRAPQPLNTGLPWSERITCAFAQVFQVFRRA